MNVGIVVLISAALDFALRRVRLGVGMTFVPALLVSLVIVAIAERRRRVKGTPT